MKPRFGCTFDEGGRGRGDTSCGDARWRSTVGALDGVVEETAVVMTEGWDQETCGCTWCQGERDCGLPREVSVA